MWFENLHEGENVGCGFWVELTACGLTRGWQSLGRTKQLPVLHSTDVFTRVGLQCDSSNDGLSLQTSTVSIHF
jgi:hypothetical protein